MNYIIQAEKAVTSLRKAKEVISDGLIIAMILKGFPESYKPFTIHMTQSSETLTFVQFKIKLLLIFSIVNTLFGIYRFQVVQSVIHLYEENCPLFVYEFILSLLEDEFGSIGYSCFHREYVLWVRWDEQDLPQCDLDASSFSVLQTHLCIPWKVQHYSKIRQCDESRHVIYCCTAMDVETATISRKIVCKKENQTGAAITEAQYTVTRHAGERPSTKMMQNKQQKDKKTKRKNKHWYSRSIKHFCQTISKETD